MCWGFGSSPPSPQIRDQEADWAAPAVVRVTVTHPTQGVATYEFGLLIKGDSKECAVTKGKVCVFLARQVPGFSGNESSVLCAHQGAPVRVPHVVE